MFNARLQYIHVRDLLVIACVCVCVCVCVPEGDIDDASRQLIIGTQPVIGRDSGSGSPGGAGGAGSAGGAIVRFPNMPLPIFVVCDVATLFATRDSP